LPRVATFDAPESLMSTQIHTHEVGDFDHDLPVAGRVRLEFLKCLHEPARLTLLYVWLHTTGCRIGHQELAALEGRDTADLVAELEQLAQAAA
jgi:hypothetical protein